MKHEKCWNVLTNLEKGDKRRKNMQKGKLQMMKNENGSINAP